MTTLGELLLLIAFVAGGYAAFAALAADRLGHRSLARSADAAAMGGLCALTGVIAVLSWALVAKDFRFAYVAQYSSRLLPWHYSLSALWVGQAGSLLLWAWFVGVCWLVCRFAAGIRTSELRGVTCGYVMVYWTFLLAVMVFGADPMAASAQAPLEGIGLSPLLQHPAMLIHPPVVFLAYALWTVPCALALAALSRGPLRDEWLEQARPWALCAWAVLGGGILLGADWAYEELGWGGYWGWDPVENGSLIPWLTGTSFIHAGMACRHRGVMKKTTLVLAVATFGLCNFATFLTRSGIFSSLHAFSRSPLGWMFLVLMLALAMGGGTLILARRHGLASRRPLGGVCARESLILIASLALWLLAGIAFIGALAAPLSDILIGRKVVVGQAFYNNALIPTGMLLLLTTALAPLTRWGEPPSARQWRMLRYAFAVAVVVAVLAEVRGGLHPLEIGVASCAGLAAAAFVGGLLLDIRRRESSPFWSSAWQTLRVGRRRYAAFVAHLGIVCLAIGIAGSSLRSRQHSATLHIGEPYQWEETSIRLVSLHQHRRADKLIVNAELLVSPANASAFTLRPAQHWHRLQREWTTEVAIHSTWSGDFYAILHGNDDTEQASLTFVVNPLMRWLWSGGALAVSAAFVALLPPRRRVAQSASSSPIRGPHFRLHARRRLTETTHG